MKSSKDKAETEVVKSGQAIGTKINREVFEEEKTEMSMEVKRRLRQAPRRPHADPDRP